VLMLVCDGLKGLPDAVGEVWPRTVVQTCVVHLLRASFLDTRPDACRHSEDAARSVSQGTSIHRNERPALSLRCPWRAADRASGALSREARALPANVRTCPDRAGVEKRSSRSRV
ncbi:transposase, partial [Streptomyces sp. NPDC005423]|uniref:transposase n=1 Tax=Streptomyces sp. NPDC005423 TaxID=3155343 RepID=UPI00339EC1F8